MSAPVGATPELDPIPTRPVPLRCKAPWAALYLDPRGEVKVCCQNEWLRLGNISTMSLKEIWHGPELERLRRRVAEDDLSLGCDMCAIAIDRGAEDSAYFNSFEPLAVDADDTTWPLQMDLALSNSCNLQCVMCNGELSSAIRIKREGRPALQSPYGNEFFAELDEFLPHLQVVTFLGGEPFLASEALRVMERLVERGLTPKCAVTTNGTQWSGRIKRLVELLPMSIAISVDAVTAPTLEAVRVGVDYDRLMANIQHFRSATSRSGGSISFSSCLMLPNWHEFGALLEWSDELDVDVFVNSVHHPPHLSFAHCPPEELARVVESLTAESTWRAPRLGRNRQVWLDQLQSVETLYQQRMASQRDSETEGGASTVLGVPVDLAPRRTGTSAGDPILGSVVLIADERQLVTRIETDGPVGLRVDLSELTGRSLWEMVGLVSASLGRLQSSTVHRDESGVEQRRMVFDGDVGTTVMTATMEIRPDQGPTWRLQFSEALGAGR